MLYPIELQALYYLTSQYPLQDLNLYFKDKSKFWVYRVYQFRQMGLGRAGFEPTSGTTKQIYSLSL